MKVKGIIFTMLVVGTMFVGGEAQALSKQQVDFFKEIQKIRRSIGLKPLMYSKKLQNTVTDKHGEVIKKEGVLMRKTGVSVSTLGMMEVIMSCNPIYCKLPGNKYVKQTIKDEAYSLFWRRDDIGKLFDTNSRRIAVTVVSRENKPDIIVATASE